jgi:hypothetical protein
MDDVIDIESENLPVAPRASQPTNGRVRMPEQNLANSYKILNFYQDNPQWLANPHTMHAANADFSQASKIIGMNLQLERLSNGSSAQRTRQQLIKQQLTMAEEVAKADPSSVASYFVQGENGVLPIEDINNFPAIAALHKQHVTAKTKPGTTPELVNLIEAAKRFRAEGDVKSADQIDAVINERGRSKGGAASEPRPYTLTIEDQNGAKVTRRMTREEYDQMSPVTSEATAKKLTRYAELKAELATGNRKKGPDWNPIANDFTVEMSKLKSELQTEGIDADTGKRSSGAVTNSPAAPVRKYNPATGKIE